MLYIYILYMLRSRLLVDGVQGRHSAFCLLPLLLEKNASEVRRSGCVVLLLIVIIVSHMFYCIYCCGQHVLTRAIRLSIIAQAARVRNDMHMYVLLVLFGLCFFFTSRIESEQTKRVTFGSIRR